MDICVIHMSMHFSKRRDFWQYFLCSLKKTRESLTQKDQLLFFYDHCYEFYRCACFFFPFSEIDIVKVSFGSSVKR